MEKTVVRKIPFPFHSMLAICSDLDETPDRKRYFEIAKFFNTEEATAMGRGIGLEVGNTIYFDMPREQFSYWNTDDRGRSMIRTLIRSGHIDCLHSFGDYATRRLHAEKALNELSQHNCKLEVWIDHATAPSNFGSDIMQGQGDHPESEPYHADITCKFGIRFVWIGRVTSIIGQNSPKSLRGIWNYQNNLSSLKTVSKEIAKGFLASIGNRKYSVHARNDVIRETRLRDGQRVYEFLRANPHWKGVSSGENADGISEVLVPRVLDRLVKREGICILYTHLGKISNRSVPFGPSAVRVFKRLSEYYLKGKILVTTTHRLLKYCLAVRDVSIKAGRRNGSNLIDIKAPFPEELDGLTIYSEEPEKCLVSINGAEFDGFKINPPDHTGRKSISLPWKKLEFPLL